LISYRSIRDGMWNMGQGPKILRRRDRAIQARERPPTHPGGRVFRQRLRQAARQAICRDPIQFKPVGRRPAYHKRPIFCSRFPAVSPMRLLTQPEWEGSKFGRSDYPTPAKDPIQLTGRKIVCQQARSSSIQEGYALTSLLPADNLGPSSRFTAPPRVSDPETEPAP